MVGRIYKGDNQTLLHTFYISALSLMISEKIFFCFSHCKFMGANDPRDVANLDPKGMIGSIYVGYHKTLLHTKIQA